MSFMRCSHCGYVKSVPVAKTRLVGMGVAAFGVFGWVSFLFAGSGHAFLICCTIFLAGLAMFIFPSIFGQIYAEGQECPKCGMKQWKEESSCSRTTEVDKPVITVTARPKPSKPKPLRLESKPLRVPSADEAENSRQIEAFKNADESDRTKERCIAAAKLSSQTLRFIPLEYMRDVAFCEELVESCTDPDKILTYLPLEMRTSEICVIAVAANRDALKFVPPDKQEIVKELLLF